jgi:hypothetical protein
MSWAERFRLKAAECRELAENTRFPPMRVIFSRLAVSYERLAVHEERFERSLNAALSPPLAELYEEATVNSDWSPALETKVQLPHVEFEMMVDRALRLAEATLGLKQPPTPPNPSSKLQAAVR